MKAGKFITAAILCVGIGTILSNSAGAIAIEPREGIEDSHHIWHDSEWWHHNYPDWMYSHHPEWAVAHRDWWFYDHQYHPAWFWAPFWQAYPIWLWGAPYHDGVWRDFGWWHQWHPDWLYLHHPEWAEARADWLRADHGMHPEWFHTNYWREHPHDWNHPDENYHRYATTREDFFRHERGEPIRTVTARKEHDKNSKLALQGSPTNPKPVYQGGSPVQTLHNGSNTQVQNGSQPTNNKLTQNVNQPRPVTSPAMNGSSWNSVVSKLGSRSSGGLGTVLNRK